MTSPATQTGDLYELISRRIAVSRSIAIAANREPQGWYSLLRHPVVAESLLDELINTSQQVVMNHPSYRPNKRPKAAITKA
ncbi:ATP-binding protein [Streptomyces sp. NPDC002928]|uniref:ATP-binding protein n=1 Tax=Streptomyces sp. NPDC002928 TaxID=3154440 RepID=UPI0033A0ED92